MGNYEIVMDTIAATTKVGFATFTFVSPAGGS
jgi:hypothetical protein